MTSPKDRLFRAFYEFDFFQAVRVLERVFPRRRPVGLNFLPGDEVVRFRPHLSLSFPPSQIVALDPPDEDRPNHLATVTFFGLYGVNGALPVHYTQLLMELVRDLPRSSPERRSLRDWLDLFNHRLLSLFYRAWEKYRFHIPFERGEAWRKEPDAFTRAAYGLIGLGSPGMRGRLRVGSGQWAVDSETPVRRPDSPGLHSPLSTSHSPLAKVDDLGLLYYAGFFAQRPRNAVNLRAMLADYFRVPVDVRQFRGQWLTLPEESQTRVGDMGTLGEDAVAGDRVWDVQSRFRLRLGPLRYSQFEDLLPDPAPVAERKTFFLVAQMARLFVGPELDFDIQLVLAADQVPDAELGEPPGAGPRLGWNMWLLCDTPDGPADDPVFDAEWVTEL